MSDHGQEEIQLTFIPGPDPEQKTYEDSADEHLPVDQGAHPPQSLLGGEGEAAVVQVRGRVRAGAGGQFKETR